MSTIYRAAHTPGPWQVGNFHPLSIFDSSEENGPVKVASAKKIMDARLIAAAPELLAALQKANEEMIALQLWAQELRQQQAKINPDALWSKLNATIWHSQARAAISRATGAA